MRVFDCTNSTFHRRHCPRKHGTITWITTQTRICIKCLITVRAKRDYLNLFEVQYQSASEMHKLKVEFQNDYLQKQKCSQRFADPRPCVAFFAGSWFSHTHLWLQVTFKDAWHQFHCPQPLLSSYFPSLQYCLPAWPLSLGTLSVDRQSNKET